ncbi:MAG: hypothetical protein ACFFCS_09660, partial [Candidatus Hodarchaeota archaeon]
TIFKHVQATIGNARVLIKEKKSFGEIEAFVSKIINYGNGNGKYPYMDEMEGIMEYINENLDNLEPETRSGILAIGEKVKELHSFLDEFIFQLAMDRMQSTSLRRF